MANRRTGAHLANDCPATGAYSPGMPNGIIESDVPARLERLPWGSFHTLVVIALGVT
jgi:hypothetical protein